MITRVITVCVGSAILASGRRFRTGSEPWRNSEAAAGRLEAASCIVGTDGDAMSLGVDSGMVHADAGPR